MELREIFETKVNLEEAEKQGILARLKFPWGKSDWKNKNGRTYPDKVFRPAVEQFNQDIAKSLRGIPGSSGHPYGGSTNLPDVSHILTKVWMDGGIAMAEADILKTTKGRDALTLIKTGVPIGASLRAFGEADEAGKVKPGLRINSVDLVVNPSFERHARVDASSILESGNAALLGNSENDDRQLRDIYKYLQTETNYKGTFGEFLRDFDRSVFSIDELTKSPESRLVESIKKRMGLLENYDEAIESGYGGSLEDFEKLNSEEDPYLKSQYLAELNEGLTTQSFEDWKKRRFLEKK